MAKPHRTRRGLRFSLRTLLLLVAVATGPLVAWRVYVEPFRQQAATMALIEQLGGSYQTQPCGAAWLRRVFGEGRFQDVTHVNLADCNEPEKYLDHIARLPRLQSLVVGGRSFGDAELTRLRELVTLQGLILDTTGTSDQGRADLCASLPDLEIVTSHRRTIALIGKTHEVEVRERSEPAWLRDVVTAEFFQEMVAVGTGWNDHPFTDAELREVADVTSLERLALWSADISADSLRSLGSLRALTELDLGGTNVSDLSPLLSLTNLKSLCVSGCPIQSKDIPQLRSLQHLDASETNVISLAPLAKLTNLESLYLRKCSIPTEELRHLVGLPKLTSLMLDDSPVTNHGLAHVGRLANLRELFLNQAEVTDDGLKHLAALDKLERLDLCYNRITDAGLLHLHSLVRLKALLLAPEGPLGSTGPPRALSPDIASVSAHGKRQLRNAIPSLEIIGEPSKVDWPVFGEKIAAVREGKTDSLQMAGVEVLHLDRIADLQALKTLDLADTILDDNGLRHVARLQSLRELQLSNTWITDAGLVHLGKLHNLTHLWLRGTRVTDAGLRHLSGLRSLQCLDLGNTKVTGSGLRHLAACERLEKLDLEQAWLDRSVFPSLRDHSGMTPEGFREIFAFRELRHVSLSGRQLTDEHLSKIAQLTKLERLAIRKTGIQGASLRHLQSLPELRHLTLSDNALTDDTAEILPTLSQLYKLSLENEAPWSPGLSWQARKRLRHSVTCILEETYPPEEAPAPK